MKEIVYYRDIPPNSQNEHKKNYEYRYGEFTFLV